MMKGSDAAERERGFQDKQEQVQRKERKSASRKRRKNVSRSDDEEREESKKRNKFLNITDFTLQNKHQRSSNNNY